MTLHDIILHNYKPYKNHRTQVLLLRLCVEGMFRGPWAMTHTLSFLSAFNLGFQIKPLKIIITQSRCLRSQTVTLPCNLWITMIYM